MSFIQTESSLVTPKPKSTLDEWKEKYPSFNEADWDSDTDENAPSATQSLGVWTPNRIKCCNAKTKKEIEAFIQKHSL